MNLAEAHLTDLSPRLRELVEIIGLPAAVKLIEARGGTRLYVPRKAEEDRLLVRLIGRPAAAKLMRRYGGDVIELDRGVRGLRAVRNRAIIAESEHRSAMQLALKYQLTERQVWKILERAARVNRRQLALSL